MRFGERRSDEEVQVNVVPFIDVLLVLLIFFLVASTFLEQSRLSITLPQADAAAAQPEKSTLRVSIDADGRVAVGEQVLNRPTIESVMDMVRAQAGDALTERPVVIAADADARHQDLVTVMDALRQLGVRRLGIATATDSP
jgi:biopolymer transport protein ExbD